MPRGGRRAGSGRKPGLASTKSRAYANALAVDGDLSPLEYMVGVLRDPEASQQRRDTFAIAAAPYTHPKLGAVAMLDAAGKSMGIASLSIVSVPHERFLSSEAADRDYQISQRTSRAASSPSLDCARA